MEPPPVPPPIPPADPPPWLKGVGGVHFPKLQESVTLQAEQVTPMAPHACSVTPATHAPLESQQPVQLAGPHGGLLVSGQAVKAITVTARRASVDERMTG